jgi:hypothetical protein
MLWLACGTHRSFFQQSFERKRSPFVAWAQNAPAADPNCIVDAFLMKSSTLQNRRLCKNDQKIAKNEKKYECQNSGNDAG